MACIYKGNTQALSVIGIIPVDDRFGVSRLLYEFGCGTVRYHMSFYNWIEYVLLNFSAAFAIALDACLLVILKFREFSKPTDALKWAAAIGFTHVLFPMIGFVGGWIVLERFPNLAAGVYALGAILLAILIRMVIMEAVASEKETDPDESKTTTARVFAFWVPVFYVSIDALLSGPAKTVLIDRYPRSLAIFSFLLVGSIVGLLTLFAGGISNKLHRRWITKSVITASGLAKTLTIGIIGEIILFSFFLTWCTADFLEHLLMSARQEVPFIYILVAGLAVGGFLSLLFHRQIWTTQLLKTSSLLK